MTKEHFERLLGTFYLEGTPNLAVTALSYWLSSSVHEQKDAAQLELHKRLFRLIRKRFPEVRARWLDLSESSSFFNDTATTEICTESLLEARPPIQTAEDLDARWAEFLVSGETQPIEEIVEVPVERIVEVPVEVLVENRYPVDVYVEREVPYETVVEVLVERPVEQVVETPVYYENIIERYYEELVEVGSAIIFYFLTLVGSKIL